jgi:hypothetical protein
MVLDEKANGVLALWKMAAFLRLCPEEVKEHVFQCIEDIGEDYEKLRSIAVSWITSRVSSRVDKGTPMDIGGISSSAEWQRKLGTKPVPKWMLMLWATLSTAINAKDGATHLASARPKAKAKAKAHRPKQTTLNQATLAPKVAKASKAKVPQAILAKARDILAASSQG